MSMPGRSLPAKPPAFSLQTLQLPQFPQNGTFYDVELAGIGFDGRDPAFVVLQTDHAEFVEKYMPRREFVHSKRFLLEPCKRLLQEYIRIVDDYTRCGSRFSDESSGWAAQRLRAVQAPAGLDAVQCNCETGWRP